MTSLTFSVLHDILTGGGPSSREEAEECARLYTAGYLDFEAGRCLGAYFTHVPFRGGVRRLFGRYELTEFGEEALAAEMAADEARGAA